MRTTSAWPRPNSLSAVRGLSVTAVVSGFGSGAKWPFRCVLALRPSAEYRTYGLPNALGEAVGMPGRGPIGSPNSTERPSCSRNRLPCAKHGGGGTLNDKYPLLRAHENGAVRLRLRGICHFSVGDARRGRSRDQAGVDASLF